MLVWQLDHQTAVDRNENNYIKSKENHQVVTIATEDNKTIKILTTPNANSGLNHGEAGSY